MAITFHLVHDNFSIASFVNKFNVLYAMCYFYILLFFICRLTIFYLSMLHSLTWWYIFCIICTQVSSYVRCVAHTHNCIPMCKIEFSIRTCSNAGTLHNSFPDFPSTHILSFHFAWNILFCEATTMLCVFCLHKFYLFVTNCALYDFESSRVIIVKLYSWYLCVLTYKWLTPFMCFYMETYLYRLSILQVLMDI